jgi:hypothetical protein
MGLLHLLIKSMLKEPGNEVVGECGNATTSLTYDTH